MSAGSTIERLQDDIRHCEEQIAHLSRKRAELDELIDYYEKRRWAQEKVLLNEKMKIER